VEALGRELDAIRRDVEESRGERDAAYIRRAIQLQRGLAAGARVTLFASAFPPAWVAGTAMLGAAKIIENMELGHNVIHGQWDWMNDPEIHSSTWEWDTTCPAEHWKHSHNYVHHKYTNVVGKDKDVGYGILRMTRDQRWSPVNLGQPLYNALLATFFQYGVALHDLDFEAIRKREKSLGQAWAQAKVIGRKVARQLAKDYVVYPLLTGPALLSTLTANATANLIRNLWSYGVIFCGHFPDGAEKFTEAELARETPPEWYLRQLLGSANFRRPADGVHVREPLLPDRAPPLPRPTQQPLRRDVGEDHGPVRQIRVALHHGLAAGAVPQDHPHHLEAVAARCVAAGHVRQRAGNRIGAGHQRPQTSRRGRPAPGPEKGQRGLRVSAACRVTVPSAPAARPAARAPAAARAPTRSDAAPTPARSQRHRTPPDRRRR